MITLQIVSDAGVQTVNAVDWHTASIIVRQCDSRGVPCVIEAGDLLIEEVTDLFNKAERGEL